MSDRPGGKDRVGTRGPIPRVVITLGFVSLLTDISSESVVGDPAALPHRRARALDDRLRLHRRPLPGRQRAGAHRAAAGPPTAADHPKWVAFVGYGLSCRGPRRASLFASGLGAISAVVTADRIGKGLRTAPRDAMISAATPTADLGRRLRRAPHPRHRRRRASARSSRSPSCGDPRRLPDRHGRLARLRGPRRRAARPRWCPTERPRRRSRSPRSSGSAGATSPTPRLIRLLVVAGAARPADGRRRLHLPRPARPRRVRGAVVPAAVRRHQHRLPARSPSRSAALADRVGRARVLVWGHGALLGAYAVRRAARGTAPPPPSLALLAARHVLRRHRRRHRRARRPARRRPTVRASGIASAQTVVALARLVLVGGSACSGSCRPAGRAHRWSASPCWSPCPSPCCRCGPRRSAQST